MENLSQWDMLQRMNAIRREKNEGMTIEVVSRFPPLESLTGLTYLGSFSWTSKAMGMKWIHEKHAYDFGAGLLTPSDIARDYLAAKFGDKRLRCNSRQWKEVVKQKRSAPLFAEPCTLTKAYYIDLKSAYWQLLQIGGFDVDYSPKRFFSPRSDVYDFPFPEVKLARNCLVSMGLPSGVNVWLPNYGFSRKAASKVNVNLILWGMVQDVLHGVASDLLRSAGCVYVNTDGYIVPSDRLSEANAILDSWGLFSVIKHEGRAEVRGAGDYDIAGHQSKRVRTVPRPFSHIKPVAIDWLRGKVKFWSKRLRLDMKNVRLPEPPEPEGGIW